MYDTFKTNQTYLSSKTLAHKAHTRIPTTIPAIDKLDTNTLADILSFLYLMITATTRVFPKTANEPISNTDTHRIVSVVISKEDTVSVTSSVSVYCVAVSMFPFWFCMFHKVSRPKLKMCVDILYNNG